MTRRCPFCAEEILADAIKCKHCGEFLAEDPQRLTAARPSAGPRTTPADASGDRTLMIVVVSVLALSLLVGGVLWLVFYGVAHGQSGAVSSSQYSQSPSPEVLAPVSAAYRSGYEEGKWSGNLDRRYDTYSHLMREESDKYLTASRQGYRRGTDEYGEFWAGYATGYAEAR